MTTELKVLWEPQPPIIVPTTATTPQEIAKCAVQLSSRDVNQIVLAYKAGSYEMMSTYVWTKAMAALKKQIASLGMEFVGEMLNRSDINELSSVEDSVTDYEAISLAQDLGMVSSTEAMRLKQTQQIIAHFASLEAPEIENEEMHPEEAIRCLRSCVQSILGHPKIEVAVQFTKFRKQLESRTFKSDDGEIVSLLNSPYFAQRTTLSVLLAMLKNSEGAQLEHSIGNINVILPTLWPYLRQPERWQSGQTYAEVVSAGRKSASAGLLKALRAVQGFDFVPESLRSNTFTRAAKEVLQAHEGINNFYNESRPMDVLASLGTTIPMPAFPLCMTATLAVVLGNSYGYSYEAQGPAGRLLDSLSPERWDYYVNECIPGDVRILEKLAWYDKPRLRWFDLVNKFDLNERKFKLKAVRDFVNASHARNSSSTKKIARDLLATHGYKNN